MAAKGYDTLIKDINALLQNQRVYIGAINSVFVEMSARIFERGEDSRETMIGTYGTKPISIARKNQSRNTGKTYFKGGYREYKSLVGKGNRGEFVNLRNTDQMKMDLGTTVNPGANEYGIGFNAQFNGKKKEWMETKYQKDIFSSSLAEDEIFFNQIQKAIDRNL